QLFFLINRDTSAIYPLSLHDALPIWAREAFDLSREDPKVRDRYGKFKESLGEKLLVARRLAEAGVGLIKVRYGSWDSHGTNPSRSEEHTSELQSHLNLVCRLLLEKKK